MARGTKKHIMTLAADLIAYLGTLQLSGGDHDGSLFEVLPWERKFVRGAFSQPAAAAVSVARGSGKSCLVAGLACAALDGPLHGRRRDVDIFAPSFDVACIIFEDVLSMMAAKYDLDDRSIWRKHHSRNAAILEHRASGARVRCHGSDPAKAHGLRSFLALLDEPSQWDSGKRDRMKAAIQTGLGKHKGSRMIALGTAPRDKTHFFGQMMRGVGCGYSQVHAARTTDPPFQRRTWKRACPSLDHLPSLEAQVRIEALAAKRNPDDLAGFQALRLNLGGSEILESNLLDADVWERIEGDAEREGAPIWGVDLGGSSASSAVAGYWPDTGRLECVAAFPTEPDLAKRGEMDGVGPLYEQCARRGELFCFGGRAVDYTALMRKALEVLGPPSVVAADRWRTADLHDALHQAQVPGTASLVPRGQGFKDGGEDVRRFRRACLESRVTPLRSLYLRSCMSEARIDVDAAGNSKLSKSTQGGRRLRARDDGAAAAILAVAEGQRQAARPATAFSFTHTQF